MTIQHRVETQYYSENTIHAEQQRQLYDDNNYDSIVIMGIFRNNMFNIRVFILISDRDRNRSCKMNKNVACDHERSRIPSWSLDEQINKVCI